MNSKSSLRGTQSQKSREKDCHQADQHGEEFECAHDDKKEAFDKKYKTFRCSKPECGKFCYTVKSLHRHYRDYHKENVKDVSIYAQKMKACIICNKSFKIQSSYGDHMEEHKVGLGTKLIQCKI